MNRFQGVKIMTNYEKFFEEQMQNPEIKKEYDRLEPTFSIIQAFIDARKASGLTQKELSIRTGITNRSVKPLSLGLVI